MGNTYSINEIEKVYEMTPYDIFNLRKDFTWSELKDLYKKLALKHHPDKKGGDKERFDYITECFKKLAKEYQARQSNKSHYELKEEQKKEIFPQSRERFETFINEESFNDKFNKMFQENKFVDEDVEFGYGDKMLKSTKNREDYDIKNLFGTEKVGNEKFNNMFNEKVPMRKDVIKYQEPSALHITKSIQYSELGKKTDDYTGKSENNQLNYTDYMKAYSEERIPTKSNRKEFKDVREYEKYSNNYVKQGLTEKERKIQEKIKNREEKSERMRQLRVEDTDERLNKYYDNVSRLMLR